MPLPFDELEAQALGLSLAERVLLADHLLASVAPDPELEQVWGAEIDRRLAEMEAGRSVLVTAEEAIARARRAIE